ncbi:MAG TPA: hypothetical protein VGK73_15110 [Polyangiaceae bacterium]
MKPKQHAFRVRPGWRISSAAARDVGRVIVELTESKRYTPKALVDAARSRKSPAHKHFEWNDGRAGELYRIEQARLYQRAIEYDVVIERARQKPVTLKMRCAYPVVEDGEPTYATGGAVSSNKDFLAQLAARAVSSAMAFRDQYDALRRVGKFSGLFREIDKLAPRETKRSAA